ncbi:MAG: hypothetical protein H7263_00185 [Candidatus Sericytochromatia bacterium]|nr:hypothetical protein [Candidatus Sericytochromatia bacterium]
MQTINRETPVHIQSINALFDLGQETDLAFITITPSVAQELLDKHNSKNRPLSSATIIKYTKDMNEGKWVEGATCISFNKQKQLADGQHRLKAIIGSGKSPSFKVSFNEPDEAFHVIDTGKKRSPSDILAIEGYSNKSNLSSMARKYNHYLAKKGNMWNIVTPCNGQETLDLVRKDEDLFKEIAQYMDNHKDVQFLGNKSDIGTIYLILKKINPAKADIFMKDLIITQKTTVHEGIDYRELIVATRNKLLGNKSLKGKVLGGRKSDPHEAESRTYWYLFDAWNSFIAGKEKAPSFKVSRATDESFPRVESFYKKD